MLLKRFLGSMDQSSSAYQNWYHILGVYFTEQEHRRSHSELPLYEIREQLSPCSRASLAIVRFGFFKTLLDWWTVGFANVNQKNTSGDSLLVLGAITGSVSITQNLLKRGAHVNASRGKFGSALQAASSEGYESVVRLLLEEGADVNASGGRYGSALQAASSQGHESVVQLLLDKGADIYARGGKHHSALQAATSEG